MQVKVYEMNDYDFVAAATAEEALSWYLSTTGVSLEEALDDRTAPEELGAERMAALQVHDEDTDRTLTFQEQLEALIANGESFPQIFASSEC